MSLRLLDLYCKAGGAGRGYADAGFEVVGVDLEPQPNYPFRFIQGDALAYLDEVLASGHDFDAIHASPPCQAFTAYKRRPGHVRPRLDLIAPTRERLRATGAPYIIENVEGAPLLNAVRVCGSAFGLDVRRHRYFESNIPLVGTPCNHGWQTARFPQATNRANKRRTVEVGAWRTSHLAADAMGIDWMTLDEITEAIPPLYTQWLGRQLHAYIRARRAA